MIVRWKLVAIGLATVGVTIAIGLVLSHHAEREPDLPVPTASPPPPVHHLAGRVTITGRVIETHDQGAVGGAKVVMRGPGGEHETTTSSDGSYELAVPPGTYRIYVRDDRTMSVGTPDRVRIDGGPRAMLANRPDESLMPVFDATDDAANIDLEVERVARLSGRVVDFDTRPVPHAIVRATGGGSRPVLGTDVVETDATGAYELRLPEGRYAIDVSHPAYATTPQRLVVVSHAAFPTHTTLEIDPGCVIEGRVTAPDGTIANDGAIEREREVAFGPTSRIEPDGTFRFSTLEETEVTLRAWPWQTAPSPAKSFACHSGARFTDVRLATHAAEPTLSGTVVDATGAPVPLVYLDVRPRSAGVLGQQERADATGTWSVFELVPGPYRLVASVPGRGIAVRDVTAPARDVRIALSGTGRIAGTTSELANGAIAVELTSCSDAMDAANQPMKIAHEPRLVRVRGGRFAIDDVPACHLTFVASWHGSTIVTSVDVVRGETTQVELELGTPRPKTITGVVRDADHAAVAHAKVTATRGNRELGAATTDDDGRFTLHALAGAVLQARGAGGRATAKVGLAAVDAERIDLVLRGDQ